MLHTLQGCGGGWLEGWADMPCLSCSTEESVYEGPQPLGPLLPVEARAGTDVPAAALHAALRVRLLPEQEVRPRQGTGRGPACHQGGDWSPHTV